MVDESKILEVQSFGMMKEYDSVERVQDSMERTLSKVGKEIVFDYRRFQWMAASLMWRIEIYDFDYVDNVLVKLRKEMEKWFDQWGIKINVKYKERG